MHFSIALDRLCIKSNAIWESFDQCTVCTVSDLNSFFIMKYVEQKNVESVIKLYLFLWFQEVMQDPCIAADRFIQYWFQQHPQS